MILKRKLIMQRRRSRERSFFRMEIFTLFSEFSIYNCFTHKINKVQKNDAYYIQRKYRSTVVFWMIFETFGGEHNL